MAMNRREIILILVLALWPVTVHGQSGLSRREADSPIFAARLAGDWSIFRLADGFLGKQSAENMDLSPFVASQTLVAQVKSSAPRKSGQSPTEKASSEPSKKVEMRIVPFFGTATTQTAPGQHGQVGLPEGVGLTVQYVLPDSPAQAGGLQRGDVLHKFNDQILINDPQFRVLVRNSKPGDKVRLTAIRKAAPVTLTVVLGKKEIPAAEVTPGQLLEWLLKPAPGVAPGAKAMRFSANYEDDEHVLVLVIDKGKKYLSAKDKQGVVIFHGPINTAQQRKAVPAAIRPKLKRLETPPKPKSQLPPAVPAGDSTST